MFGTLGAPELLIIAGVIVLIFGVGKISGLGRELGSSIKEFRRAVKDPEEEEGAEGEAAPVAQAQVQQPAPAPPPVQPAAPPPAAAAPAAQPAPPPAETASTEGEGSKLF